MRNKNVDWQGTEVFLQQLRGLAPQDLVRARAGIDSLLGSGAEDGETGKSSPARLFSVAEGVRYLDGNGLDLLTRSFKAWAGEEGASRSRRSRLRMWLVFLLLRYTGARLAEVLGLDDQADLDFLGATVRFRSGSEQGTREVPVPECVMEEMRTVLTDPLMRGLEGGVLKLDQGHVRRQFYAQSERCGLPKELLNPRTLRHSRAVELLRGGIPLPAVQSVLGHATLELTSGYYTFSESDTSRIVQSYIQKERTMKTSARNTFQGKVTGVRCQGIQCEVVLRTKGGHEVVSLITDESATRLGIKEGKSITALIKAPWVLIEKDERTEHISARNRFAGKIERIRKEELLTEVVGILKDGTSVCALITTQSADALGLKEGQTVWFLVKATAVILSAD